MAPMALTTECSSGHIRTPENTRIYKHFRICRICNAAYYRARAILGKNPPVTKKCANEKCPTTFTTQSGWKRYCSRICNVRQINREWSRRHPAVKRRNKIRFFKKNPEKKKEYALRAKIKKILGVEKA